MDEFYFTRGKIMEMTSLMIQAMRGLQAGSGRNFPAWEMLLLLVLEVLFLLRRNCQVLLESCWPRPVLVRQVSMLQLLQMKQQMEISACAACLRAPAVPGGCCIDLLLWNSRGNI